MPPLGPPSIYQNNTGTGPTPSRSAAETARHHSLKTAGIIVSTNSKTNGAGAAIASCFQHGVAGCLRCAPAPRANWLPAGSWPTSSLSSITGGTSTCGFMMAGITAKLFALICWSMEQRWTLLLTRLLRRWLGGKWLPDLPQEGGFPAQWMKSPPPRPDAACLFTS